MCNGARGVGFEAAPASGELWKLGAPAPLQAHVTLGHMGRSQVPPYMRASPAAQAAARAHVYNPLATAGNTRLVYATMTPQSIEFNKAVAALATHRDRHISVARLVSGGVQFLGFERVSWNTLQPLLAQYGKCGTISSNGSQLALRLEDEVRVGDPEPLADTSEIGPVQNLLAAANESVKTPSVNRLRFAYIDASTGVTTRTLASISALPSVINIKIDRDGVSVLTATQTDFATGLYHTIRQWKQAPHLQPLSSRRLARSMKHGGRRRAQKHGSRLFRS